MNPVKAGLVKEAGDWPFSSSRHYDHGQRDDLVDDYEKPSYDIATELTG